MSIYNWYFKAYENMQLHLAFIDEADGCTIKFTNTNGQLWNKLSASSKEDAIQQLQSLGFRQCEGDQSFTKLFGLPTEVVYDDWYYEGMEQIYSQPE